MNIPIHTMPSLGTIAARSLATNVPLAAAATQKPQAAEPDTTSTRQLRRAEARRVAKARKAERA